MKSSIRKNFTLIFIALVALLLVLMYFVYGSLLQKYYTNEKIFVLQEAYTAIDNEVRNAEAQGKTLISILNEEYDQNSEDGPIASLFRDFTEGSNIDVAILDDSGMVSATSRESQWISMKLKAYIAFSEVYGKDVEMMFPIKDGRKQDNNEMPPDINMKPVIKNLKKFDNFDLQIFHDHRSNTDYLECWGKFSDGMTYFLLSMPLASIGEATAVSKRFLLVVLLLVAVIGAAAVYFTTGRITKPINELAQISERMSDQDFSVKYTGKSNNEIGVLGQSMNKMSAALESVIAELKDANSKLQDDIDAKTKIDEMRKEFIADVSHELKTPISIIEGYAEGLVEGMADEKETREYYCGVIMDEAAKMNKMVKQLTSLINYEFNENTDEFEEFELSELINSVVNASKIKFNNADAKVSFHKEVEGEAFVYADAFKIEEVITNYINNAINHLNGDRNIEINISDAGEFWRVSVYNDGTPIPEESLDKIWEKFYKVDKSRSRQYGGSGIGLSIVKAIMDSCGGKYGVENKEHGVEFYFSLKKFLTV